MFSTKVAHIILTMPCFFGAVLAHPYRFWVLCPPQRKTTLTLTLEAYSIIRATLWISAPKPMLQASKSVASHTLPQVTISLLTNLAHQHQLPQQDTMYLSNAASVQAVLEPSQTVYYFYLRCITKATHPA